MNTSLMGSRSLRLVTYTLFARVPTKFVVNTVNHVDVSWPGPSCFSRESRLWSLPRLAGSCHIRKPGKPCRSGALRRGHESSYGFRGPTHYRQAGPPQDMGGVMMKSAYGRQTPPPDYELT